MPASSRRLIANMLSDLKQERDELAVQIHLGKQEVKDEWDSIENKLNQLNHRFDPLKDAIGETSEEIWEAFKLVGDEIKDGFHRIRKSL